MKKELYAITHPIPNKQTTQFAAIESFNSGLKKTIQPDIIVVTNNIINPIISIFFEVIFDNFNTANIQIIIQIKKSIKINTQIYFNALCAMLPKVRIWKELI